MRRYLGLAAALLLLVILVLFAVREVNKDEREGKKPVKEIVFPYGSAQVLEIEIKNPDGSARFRRGTGGWEAAEAPADADLSSVPDLI